MTRRHARCIDEEKGTAVALPHGRKLVFDPRTERFVNDEEANRYLTRKYREPYVLPRDLSITGLRAPVESQ